MDVYTLSSSSFFGLSSNYSLDSKLKFQENISFTEQGINVPINNAFKDLNDNTLNNFSNLFLSRKDTILSSFKIDPLAKLEDEGFSTFFAANALGTITPSTKFWVVGEPPITVNTAVVKVSGDYAGFNNQYLFDIELLDDKLCKILHENEGIIRYLTVDYTGNLSFCKDIGFDSLGALSPQIFYYVYDRNYDFIILLKNINDISKFVFFSSATDSLTLVDPITGTTVPYNIQSVFRVRSRNTSTNNTFLLDPWVSYKKDFKTNLQDINTTKSFDQINSNFLYNNEFFNLSGSSLNVNALALKNTNTPENFQSRNNPFFSENSVEFRDYQTLFTGHNQQYGNDNISLNYESYTSNILLKRDKVTYFHIPQNFYPFLRLNINDSGLVEAGAIAGDHPIKADKIFKKKADYKYTSNFGDTSDETTGSFLCSWLSGNRDPNVKPLWVDRYYNPRNISFLAALTSSEIQAIRYISIFDCLVNKAYEKFGNIDVFDKPSDLIFEKGTYYAYHHYGPKDVDKFIKSINDNVINANLPVFKYFNGSDVYPSSQQADEFVFEGNRYASTGSLSAIQESNQFTLMFDGYSSDWTKNLGYQLLGNYDRDGFGMFNTNLVTPTMFINAPSAIFVTNIDFTRLNKITFNSEIKGIIRLQGLNDIYGIFEDNSFRRYNLAYAETRRTYPPGNLKLGNLISLDYTEDKGYALINNGTNDNRILELNLQSNVITQSQLTRTFAPNIGFFNLNTSSTVNYYNNILYFTNGSKSERIGDKIYFLSKDSKTVLLWNTTQAITITAFRSSTKIDDFTIDFDSNIWLLYNTNCFAKYTAERGFILSGSFDDSKYKNYKVDILADFNEGEYNKYALVTRQSQTETKKLKFIKLNLDGSTKTSTLYNANTATGRNFSNSNFLRSFVKSKYSETNLNIKAKLTNVFNFNDTASTEVIFNLSSIDPGYHHFAVRFDADNGIMQLFVDGQLVGADLFKPRKYKFSNIIQRPFLIGTSSYAFSIPLFSYLKNTSFLVNDFTVKNFYLYSRPLYDFDIQMHTRKGMQIHDIRFDVACGRRNYLEEIERYFKLNPPGSKSTQYNITIRNSGITDPELKLQLEKRVVSILRDSAPVYTKLNMIKWSN
jgi:hypothetical protein